VSNPYNWAAIRTRGLLPRLSPIVSQSPFRKAQLILLRLALLTAIAIPAFSQVSNIGPLPEFEVATIKPTDKRGAISGAPGLFIASGVTLKTMAGYAYQLRPFQIAGASGWIDSDLWQVQAKAADGMRDEQTFSLMLRSLLADRFNLKAHVETRELQVYELIVDARGLTGMRLSEDQNLPGPPERLPSGQFRSRRGIATSASGEGMRTFEATAVKVDELVNKLTNELQSPVINKTVLTGLYDIPKMRWATDPALSSAGSIFAAVQDLGLRLVSTKGPTQVIVIDNAEKPSPN